jgi:diaminopimelate decarboxylase
VNAPTGRPPAFSYQAVRKGVLWRASPESLLQCDDIPLPRLAERYGTPLYIYSATTIRERTRAFQRAFRKAVFTVCYSVKANSNLSLLRLLASMGCGFDVVSGGELERVLHVGRKAARMVVFSGVGKQREELEAALRAGILLFNVESESELSLLAECASRLKRNAPVALRVNPDVPAKTHPYISTGLHQHKFGIPISQARELYACARHTKRLDPRGVSVHIGSQIIDVEPFTLAMQRVAELVRDLRKEGHRIEYVDAGGGLGIPYEQADGPEFGQYASALLGPLKNSKVHLLLEPGRSIVGPAGALLTTVLYRKTNNGKKFVIVDAAMNDLLRPSLYNAYHEIVPVRTKQGATTETVDVVGPVCETGDFFAREREIPSVDEGDLLAILDVGAYGMVLSSNYNTRPRAAEVLVDGKTARVIRRRESVEDMLRAEQRP